MTKDLKLCKCGIAEVDCDYHKPEEKSNEYIAFPDGKTIHIPLSNPIKWTGKWNIPKDSKLDYINGVAKRIGNRWRAEVINLMAGVYLDNNEAD